MKLREYQDNFILNVSKKLRISRKICAQLATGGGKTIIFSSIAQRYTAKNDKSVLIVVNRKELLQQTRKTLYRAYGINAELIVAGSKYVAPAKIYLGMVESVNRRMSKIKNVGLFIIDEAHRGEFNKLHDHFPEALILGFTATPISGSKKTPMNIYYEDIVPGIQISELIKQGFLCQNITRAPKDVVQRSEIEAEMKKRGMSGKGDYDEAIMAEAFSKPKYIHNTVEAYKRYALGTKTIVFNCNMSHSNQVCNAFVEAGYSAKTLDSNMPDADRDAVLKWFKETADAILCNVAIATTGFDEPTIESVLVNKATMSLSLWLQMTGRGGRIVDEKFIEEKQSEYPYELKIKDYFTIVDMGGNAVTHGDWCQDRDWLHIFNNPPKPGSGDGIAPVKSCPECEAIIPAQARVCDYCGYAIPEKTPLQEGALDDFVIVTKDIDVTKIMFDNQQRNEYYTFFKIGSDLAKKAKQTVKVMSNEIAMFVLHSYFELAKEWVSKYREQNKKNPDAKKLQFNEWHRVKAKEHLFKELNKLYPEWESQATSASTAA